MNFIEGEDDMERPGQLWTSEMGRQGFSLAIQMQRVFFTNILVF
jgi:hypothetical protein